MLLARPISLRGNLFARRCSNEVAQYKEKIRKQDRVLRGLTDNARVIVINNTRSTNVAKDKHQLSNLATRLLGRGLSAAAILATALKGEERIMLEWMAEGPMKKLYAEASRAGEVRGYVSDPKFDMTDSTPLGYAMRVGDLRVTHILYNMATPYLSNVAIAGADVTSDIENYFKQVDQIPSIVQFDTILDSKGYAKFSGGLVIQPLPQSSPEEANRVIEEYRQHLKQMPPIGVLFDEDLRTLDEVMEMVGGKPITAKERIVVDFHCRCSRDMYHKQLKALAPSQKVKLLELYEGEEFSENVEVDCQFCNEHYVFTKDEL